MRFFICYFFNKYSVYTDNRTFYKKFNIKYDIISISEPTCVHDGRTAKLLGDGITLSAK